MNKINSNKTTKSSGFTLIELMIVLAIIAILAVIAIPAYNAYVAKGFRESAKTELMSYVQAQSRWYAQNLSYNDQDTAFGYATNGLSDISDNPRYQIDAAAVNRAGGAAFTCTAGACNNVSILAQLKPGFEDSECGSLWIDTTGARGSSGGGDECWR